MNTRRYRRHLLGVALVGALAGLLIWSKLRLATDVPRSAYAVPEATGQEKPASDEQPETPAGEPEGSLEGAGAITPALSD